MNLIYIGDGAFVPSYPARDLTADEVTLYGEAALLATGLYKKVDSDLEEHPIRVNKNKESK